MKNLKNVFVSLTILSTLGTSLASAQTLGRSLVLNPVILKVPVACLSCPDLSRLPKFEEGLSLQDKQEVIAQMDNAFRHLKDLPDVSRDIRTSVDYWERLQPKEKENILGHRFGDTMNAAVAAVVVAAAALAWDVYKDYRQTNWNPADMGFDRIRTLGSLDYLRTSNVRLEAVQSLQSRLNAFRGLGQVGLGLNY